MATKILHLNNRILFLGLSDFEPTNSKELSTFISTSARKSSVLDPVPGIVMSDCLHVLLPAITRIVNLSLTTGIVPPKMKEASLSPLLKQPSLSHEEFPNYRPISNLAFISKCTEKVLASRLNEHVNKHNLSEVFQSAYKKGHSTESALVRVHNDILRAIDNGGCVILLLLDLSAAFDTVDHAILLSRLRDRFGVSGTALAWFQSYLSDRSQFVSIDGKRSSKRGSFLRSSSGICTRALSLSIVYFAIGRHNVENMDFLFMCMQMIHRFILSLSHS